MPLIVASVVVASCVISAGIHLALPRFVTQRNKRQLAERCAARRAIALTFDDGPGRVLTPLVLQRLADAGVPATFFLIGRQAVAHADLVAEIVRRGHEVGSHGENHVHHVWSWPWSGVLDTRAALHRMQTLLQRDAAAISFRPPYGKVNLLSLAWATWRRVPIVLWTHDAWDARTEGDLTPAALAEALRRAGGGVVLLHDFDRHEPETGQRVLEKLDAILSLRHEGFEFVRVGDLLGHTMPAAVEVRAGAPAPQAGSPR